MPSFPDLPGSPGNPGAPGIPLLPTNMKKKLPHVQTPYTFCSMILRKEGCSQYYEITHL